MARHTTCRPIAEVPTSPGWAGAGSWIAAVVILLAALTIAVELLKVAIGTANPNAIATAALFLFAAALTAMAALKRIRDYFFDGKLGCIAEEECAIGQVELLSDNEDGDIGLNLILAPVSSTDSQAEYRAMPQAARLVYRDPGVATADPQWTHDPWAVRRNDPPVAWGPHGLPFFHTEIEGTFFDEWSSALLALIAAVAALAFVVFGLAVVGTIAGPLGWVLVALALLLVLLGVAGRYLPDVEDLDRAEVEPLGEAVPDDTGAITVDPAGHVIAKGDYVVMTGRHVVDTGHANESACWNELHPVRAIAKVSRKEYERAVDTEEGRKLVDDYCQALRGFLREKDTVEQELIYLEHPRVG